MTPKPTFSELILTAVRREVLKRLVFSKPQHAELPKRISARLCAHRGRRVLAMEFSLEGNTVSQKNIPEASITEALSPYLADYGQVNLLTTAGVLSSKDFDKSFPTL